MPIIDEVNNKLLEVEIIKNEIEGLFFWFSDLIMSVNYRLGDTVAFQMEGIDGIDYKFTAKRTENGKYSIELVRDSRINGKDDPDFYMTIMPDYVSYRTKRTTTIDHQKVIYENFIKYTVTDEKVTKNDYIRIVESQKQEDGSNRYRVEEKTCNTNYDKSMETSKVVENLITDVYNGKMTELHNKKYLCIRDENPSLVIVKSDNKEFISKVEGPKIPELRTLLDNMIKTEKFSVYLKLKTKKE